MARVFRSTLARGTLLAALLGAIAPAGFAQKATEMFIPLGQSAGLSGKHTMLARVQSVNQAQRSLTLVQDGSVTTVRLGAQTPVWFDRSKLSQTNSLGTLAEVKPGMAAEIKFQKNNRSGGEAEWVKVQIEP
ncbi:MAG: hypothetical protein WA210_23410 [Burkholderiaceae bacterium]